MGHRGARRAHRGAGMGTQGSGEGTAWVNREGTLCQESREGTLTVLWVKGTPSPRPGCSKLCPSSQQCSSHSSSVPVLHH